MSLEFWTAFASIGTLIVIAATAVAALIQLRHLRAANHLNALQTFFRSYEGQDLREAFHFVRSELVTKLQDPEFRRELRSGDFDRAKHPEIQICNFFDQWGHYYRNGAIDKESFMQGMAGVVVSFWEQLEPVIAMMTERRNNVNLAFENFELLAIHAHEWMQRHPAGTFPKGQRRLELADPWRATDEVRKAQE